MQAGVPQQSLGGRYQVPSPKPPGFLRKGGLGWFHADARSSLLDCREFEWDVGSEINRRSRHNWLAVSSYCRGDWRSEDGFFHHICRQFPLTSPQEWNRFDSPLQPSVTNEKQPQREDGEELNGIMGAQCHCYIATYENNKETCQYKSCFLMNPISDKKSQPDTQDRCEGWMHD